MKKYLLIGGACLILFLIVLNTACKKSSPDNGSFAEEFVNMATITQYSWRIVENSSTDSFGYKVAWGQGIYGTDKSNNPYGFPAYSYKSNQDEYAYSYSQYTDTGYSISSWLITPVFSVKNGDKISFYTRGTKNWATDRMQVLMDGTTSPDVGTALNSVGDFKTILFDINSGQTAGGYPSDWTRYEYTFSGISGSVDTRIAFRYYADHPIAPVGIGLDLFQFQAH